MFGSWYENASRKIVSFEDFKSTRYRLANPRHLDTLLRLTLFASNGYIEVRIYASTFMVVTSHTVDLVGM